MKKEKIKAIIDSINIEGFENFGEDEINGGCYLVNRINSQKWFQIILSSGNESEYTYIEI